MFGRDFRFSVEGDPVGQGDDCVRFVVVDGVQGLDCGGDPTGVAERWIEVAGEMPLQLLNEWQSGFTDAERSQVSHFRLFVPFVIQP